MGRLIVPSSEPIFSSGDAGIFENEKGGPLLTRLHARLILMDQMSFAIATAVSDMRLEKPHSLSYQVRMRTKLPSRTLV